MTTEDRVIEHLKGIPARRDLANQLGADPDRLFCYYVCPLSNLASIIQGGIKCHDAAAAKVDLSSCEVQHRRRTIWLGRSTADPGVRRAVPTHSCVNFFWNPLNRTFEAFQRNALIRRHSPSGSADEMVCLLEVDAESLLRDNRIYWGASARNIACGNRTYFQLVDLLTPERFPWDAIFSSGPSADRQSVKHRAAEFVVFSGAGPNSEPIPWRWVRRILLPANRPLRPKSQRILVVGKATVTPSDLYKAPCELLKAERCFISYLATVRKEIDTEVAHKIEAAFRCVVAFENRIGTPHRTPYRFCTDSQAFGVHGIGHVVRVMFWARFLLCYEDASRSSASDSCLMAALLHDLCRATDRENTTHGRVAAEHFADKIRATLGPIGEASVASAANAVTMHCRADADCPVAQRDLVWAILKDADALERGRFGLPNRPGGCDWTYLRSPLLKHRDEKNRIGSLAFHLAAITKYTTWSQSPCADLFTTFYAGMRAAERESVFVTQPDRSMASMILEKLSSLAEQLYYRQYDDSEWDGHEDEVDANSEDEENCLDDGDLNEWDDHDCEVDDEDWNSN